MLTEFDDLHLKTFTISEVCRVTGVSRALLLKLEKKGIIKPYSIDKSSGYRRYTHFEISSILQYKMLREMGFSQDEILHYYTDKTSLNDIIGKMKHKRDQLQRAIEELEVRLDNEDTYSYSFVELPDVTCYCGTTKCITPADTEKFTALLSDEIIRLGITILSYEPLFALRRDSERNVQGDPDNPFEVTICIPIVPDTGIENAASDKNDLHGHIETVKGGKAFSQLYHGGYGAPNYMTPHFHKLWEEIRKRGLKTTGLVRAIGLVAPYVGLDIDPDKYVFRFAAMIKGE